MASIKQAFNEAVERGKCNIYLFIIKYLKEILWRNTYNILKFIIYNIM